VEEWLEFSRELDCPNIELSAALHPTMSEVPTEALLDPVANTLDLRQPFDRSRASRVHSAMRLTGVGLSDLAYFDNMLAADATIRRQKHEFMVRVFDAAVLLGTNAVCGFVGRNPQLEMDANLEMFEASSSLAQRGQARGLTYRVEQCPMPGWQISDGGTTTLPTLRVRGLPCIGSANATRWEISFASTTIHRMRSLIGQDSRSIFQYLKDTGYNFLIAGFHVKGQVIDARESRRGATAANPWNAATGSAPRPRRFWRSRECLEKADGILRARIAGHGAP